MTKAKNIGAVERATLLKNSAVMFNNLIHTSNSIKKVIGRNTFICDIKKTDY